MNEQLELELRGACPLYGCRLGCSCSPEKRRETARRLALLEAKRSGRRPPPVAGPSGKIPF